MWRVLVVDDEADVRFVVRAAFVGAGHDVVEAGHGRAAVDLIGVARPDLVVTDIMMPVMDGRELIVWLRARQETLAIPILALTGLPAESVGADATLKKPFAGVEVLDAGLSLLGRAV